MNILATNLKRVALAGVKGSLVVGGLAIALAQGNPTGLSVAKAGQIGAGCSTYDCPGSGCGNTYKSSGSGCETACDAGGRSTCTQVSNLLICAS